MSFRDTAGRGQGGFVNIHSHGSCLSMRDQPDVSACLQYGRRWLWHHLGQWLAAANVRDHDWIFDLLRDNSSST